MKFNMIRKYIDKAMQYIGGKWKVLIIASLLQGEKRFNELMKSIDGITQRSLVLQLRELEEDQIIIRKEIPESPNKFSYTLTSLGKSLHYVIEEIMKWGKQIFE